MFITVHPIHNSDNPVIINSDTIWEIHPIGDPIGDGCMIFFREPVAEDERMLEISEPLAYLEVILQTQQTKEDE